nr:MAG TPA: CLLAC-motif containing domain protein [Bacteriophage sp.]DAS17802.1 MAG TPA: CLLAC-motif containing domain protein [Caudoviricetes sp.]
MCYNFLECFSECLIGFSIGTLFLYTSGYHNRQCV